jgi:tape measure domain-containing protein
MADEKIVIQIQDKIAHSIIPKLKAISEMAFSANKSVLELQKNLRSLKKDLIPTSVSARLSDIRKQSLQATNGVNGLQKALSRLKSPSVVLPKAPKTPTVAPGGAGSGFVVPGALKGAVGAYLGFQGAKEIILLSSAYTDLQNKLKMVTNSNEELVAVTQRVFEIANKTRVPVEDTAKAFVRFDLALQQMGVSQKDTLRMTETVNKMLIISGATAGEAGSSLLQLSQAFNKGKLDGDEFRSVMELMPPVADAIAKKLGVTRGELLKLAPQGKITSKIMFEALASVATEIDEKFGKTIPTIGQSLIQLKNTAVQVFGEIAEDAGFRDITTGIQDFGQWLRENKDSISDAATGMFNVAKGMAEIAKELEKLKLLSGTLKLLGFVLDKAATGIDFTRAAMIDIGKLGVFGNAGFDELTEFAGKEGAKEQSAVNRLTYDLLKKDGTVDAIDKLNEAAQRLSLSDELSQASVTVDASNWVQYTKQTNDELDKANGKIKEIKVNYQSLIKMNQINTGSFDYLTAKGLAGWKDVESLTPNAQLERSQKQTTPMNEFILGQTNREVMQEAFDPTLSMKAQYEKYYEDIKMLRSADLIDEKKANELKVAFKKKETLENLDATANMLGSIGTLMQSSNKKQFQIGKAATLAEASIRGVMAVQGALGSAPYGYAAIANAVAVGVMSAANIAKIANTQPPGFKEGGFTGYEGTSQVAGVVHGQEFVTNAAATARYRPMLERINKGGSAVSVTIENYGTNKDFEVQQVTPDQIRIIARDEVRSQVPSLMASESMNPNSKFSKAMQNSTNLQRKRV